VPFFRHHTDAILVNRLTPKLATTLSVSIAVALCMAAPVSAFYFQLYYFETDKMVYEVGETIDMVAKLVADFAESGWCYVSFSLVTDLGPVFSEGYFISSLPDVRFLSSSHVIMPNETAPGANGTEAEAIFNFEIYDEYSQSGSQVVNVNLKRGPLVVLPETPLSIHFGTNTTLILRIASAHNTNIPFSNRPISLSVRDSTQKPVLETNVTTDSHGRVYLNWAQSMCPPGTYNLTLSTAGSTSFLPFSQSQWVIVEPGLSTLRVLSAPDYVYCEFPAYGQADILAITAEHMNSSQLPISNSIIEWSTLFSNGFMTNLGNGEYSTAIPFYAGPGLYFVNLTATNSLYQTAVATINIQSLPRPLSASISVSPEMLSGSTVYIDAQIVDSPSGLAVCLLPATIRVSIGSTSLTRYVSITNSTGHIFLALDLPRSVWGTALISLEANRTMYHDCLIRTLISQVTFMPDVLVQPIVPVVLGQDAEVRVCVLDPNGTAIGNVVVELHAPDNGTVAWNYTNSEGITCLHWLVPRESGFGTKTYSLLICRDVSRFVHRTTIPVELTVFCPLHLLCPNNTLTAMRNNNVTIDFTVESQGPDNQHIMIRFRDNLGEITSEWEITTDVSMAIRISVGPNVSLGRHILLLEATAPYLFQGQNQVEVLVTGTIHAHSAVVSAFYGENLLLNVSATDDNNETVSVVDIRMTFVDTGFQVCMNNITTNKSVSVALPLRLAPGLHSFILEISQRWLATANESLAVFIWMRTNIVITISVHRGSLSNLTGTDKHTSSQTYFNAPSNSSGSIIRPPPILFNETTSTEPPTARETSLASCPRFSSGTSNLSTVLANSLTSVSGNGHTVFNLRDRSETASCFVIITSSTVLEVHPNDTIPHSALRGPETITSVSKPFSLRIFAASLRISLS